MAYLLKEDLEKAVEDFSEAIKQKPTRLDFYWSRANTYLELGQPKKALADSDTVLDLIEKYGKSKPGVEAAEARTLSLRAQSYVRLGEIKKASDDADRAVKLDPQWTGGPLARGLAELAGGKTAEAEKDFTKAIELAAPSERGMRARALYYRGQARKELGQTEKGQADQLEAKQLFPAVTRAPALPGESPAPEEKQKGKEE